MRLFNDVNVLDLSDHQGMFCSYLLAQVGCDVIVVEPPGGSPARVIPPLFKGQSLWWHAYARGKRSVTLDLAADTKALHALIEDADIIVHCFSEREAASLGLDRASLAVANEQAIIVAITPFGSDGPKSNWPATDLTVWAASGAHYLGGDADRAPVRTSVPQAFQHAGADAAGAALIGLYERQTSGQGQHIDISAQVSSAQAALSANLAIPNSSGYEVEREAGGLRATFPIRLTWPSKDGYVAITFLFGPAFDEPNRRLLAWCQEEGFCSDEDVTTAWGQELMAMTAEQKPPDAYFEVCARIEAFTKTKTQQALFEEGLKRGIYIAPTFDLSGLMTEPQFTEREYWQALRLTAFDSTIRVPGPFAKFSTTPLLVTAEAPVKPGISHTFTHKKSAETATQVPSARPLEGLKVLDFMWVIAGPFFTRVLANYGATVIKLESSIRLEPARSAPTFKNAEAGVETGVPYANFNTDKLGLTIDPSNPIGREVILDLVKWADVVTESFSPKAMQAWGLDYESLKKINPDLIMLSSCLMGQTGPRAQVAGYGNMAAALSGFYDLTGWADRTPAGPYLAYTDAVAPRLMLVSLMAALEHRRKTGEGQRIDISQAEAAIHLLAPAVLDYELSGHIWHRSGNRDLQFSPHGVFPTQEHEGWIALSVRSSSEWQSLCRVLGLVDLGRDLELNEHSARRAAEDSIEAAITAATEGLSVAHLEAELIAQGVPAHRVLNSQAAQSDPQFLHRNHFIEVPHTPTGSMVVENTRFRFSRTPGRVDRAGPALGEHNFEVLKEILAYDDDKIADIYASLAME
jgi:crotonobetainyl-CoA:carnitine CoA-transferase CaiB-like acyl-CoA transferase